MASNALRNRGVTAPELIRRLLLSWLTAVTAAYLRLPRESRGFSVLECLCAISPGWVTVVGAAVFLLLWALSRFWNRERYLLPAAVALLGAVSLSASFSPAFLGAWALVLAVSVAYGCRGWNGSPARSQTPTERRVYGWITAGLAVLFFGFVSLWTVARVYSFHAPTYDFGIFSQMFHHMKSTGIPATTLERDGYLSHFAVHVSPIWYLLLPFYALAPTPATLQVLQAAVMASSVVPLWKLGKLHGLHGWQRMLLCAALLLMPGFSGGAGYDIHENCFLTPLLLWLLYGIDRKHGWLTAAAALLTLMVKEDAAVYVAVAGLFAAVRGILHREKWLLRAGLLLTAGAVAWFLAVTAYLSKLGDGVMTGRYQNFMYDGSGSLLTVVTSVLICPMKAIYECVDPEKLRYLALTLLPLLGLPLLTRRFERYLLLIPYVLVNLMSDYSYQHDILFQYNFGSAAFLFYLALLNLSDWTGEWKRVTALVAALIIGACCLGKEVIPTAISYPGYCEEYADYYDSLRTALEAVPDDASVAATTYLTTELSERDVLYDVRYAAQENVLSAEYVVLKVSDTGSYSLYQTEEGNGYDNLVALLLENGYTMHEELTGILEIYRKAG